MNVKSNMPHVFSPFVLPFRLFVYMMAFILNSSTIWTSLNWHNLGKWHVRVSLYVFVFVLRLNVCLKYANVCVFVCARARVRGRKKSVEKKVFSTCIKCANKLIWCALFYFFCFVFGTTTVWHGLVCCVVCAICFVLVHRCHDYIRKQLHICIVVSTHILI